MRAMHVHGGVQTLEDMDIFMGRRELTRGIRPAGPPLPTPQ
jgi:hypothetical protein